MDKLNITLRPAKKTDLEEIQKMFVATIKTVCYKDYNLDQINAWISKIEDAERWINRIDNQYFILALHNNSIVGFASLEDIDYLDVLYVHKDYQRQGVATRLYNEIESESVRRGAIFLNSNVSLTARPFFEKKGFKKVSSQVNMIQNVEIINLIMIKILMTKKEIAIAFLSRVAKGNPQEVFNLYVGHNFKHHNPYFEGDSQSLIVAMEESAQQSPNKIFEVKRALQDENLVAIHSYIRKNKDDKGVAAVHIFRFEADKIVELWEVTHPIPFESENEYGMF